MNTVDSEIKNALDLPDASQICLAVWNLDKASQKNSARTCSG